RRSSAGEDASRYGQGGGIAWRGVSKESDESILYMGIAGGTRAMKKRVAGMNEAYFDQSSIRNPGTRRKSRILRVTRVASRSKTVSAILKSIFRIFSLSFLCCSRS